jgi:hypothetical protein
MTPDAIEPEHKELKDGRYVLLAPLGQGSQGTTWDAVDKREGRPVAVKAFDVRGARAWKDVELAEREARVLSELRHPRLPRYIEHFEQDGALYLVMEKVDGTPLSVVQASQRTMSEKDLTRFLHDADEALTYLHGRSPPVIHRDIKPSNVIRTTNGSYSFVDFGAVRDRLRPEGGSTVVGTFGYMAPEQFQGRATPASDVYAVGATAMALLTGKEPEKLPHRGLALDVRAALGGSVSRRLEDALVRMLEPDPDRRATSIGPLLEAERPPTPRPAPFAPEDPFGRSGRRAGPPPDLRDLFMDKHARRAAKRAAKWARREARRARRRGRPRLPFPLQVFFTLGLAIAEVVVGVVLNVVVPLVLTILSIVFGRGLRRAAESVDAAGREATRSIADTRVHLGDEWTPVEVAPRVRVETKPTDDPRVRVDVSRRPEAPVDDAVDAEEEDPPAARRQRRR